MDVSIVWVIDRLRDDHYVIHPEGQIGTCGRIGSRPWTCRFVTGHRIAIKLLAAMNGLEELTKRTSTN